MTSHGFLGFRVCSEPSLKELAKIAGRISGVPGVIWAHVVRGPQYNIIVEFGHMHEGRADEEHEKLIASIRHEVESEGEHNVLGVGLWVILCSFHDRESREKGEKASFADSKI